MDIFVGVDIGTSRIKLVGLDEAGVVVVEAARLTPWNRVATGAEVEPMTLTSSVSEVFEQAADLLPKGSVVRTVGFASFGEAGILERGGEPLTPVIAWFDSRGAPQAELLAERYEPEFSRATGLAARPLVSLAKLRWMVDELGVDVTGCSWYSVAEWLVKWFGGSSHSEWSLASRTGFLSIRDSAVWPGALEFLGTSAENTPNLLRFPGPPRRGEGSMCRGPTPFHGAVLSTTGLDHLVGAECIGATEPGVLVDSCGTAEAIMRFIPEAQLTDTLLEQALGAGMTIGRHTGSEGFVAIAVARTGVLLESIKDIAGCTGTGSDGTGFGGTGSDGTGTKGVEPTIEDDGSVSPEVVAEIDPGQRVKVIVEDDGTVTVLRLRPGVSREAIWRAGLNTAMGESSRLLGTVEECFGPPEHIVVTGGWTRNRSFMQAKLEQLPSAQHYGQQEAGAVGAALRGRFGIDR